MSFSAIPPRFGAQIVGKTAFKQDGVTVSIRLSEKEKQESKELFDVSLSDVLVLRSRPERDESRFTVNRREVAGREKAAIKDIILNSGDILDSALKKRLLEGINDPEEDEWSF